MTNGVTSTVLGWVVAVCVASVCVASVCVAALPWVGAAAEPAPFFVDATEASGLDFVHLEVSVSRGGSTGGSIASAWHLPEIIGPGVALLDFDNDGDLDVYLVQGGDLLAGKLALQAMDRRPMDRLFRNDLEAGRGLRFTDVTDASGLRATGYGMAAMAADFDNDGWTDLYVANVGANQLWRNRGTGRGFEDVTERWRSGDRRWSVALSVADLDADGWLDLYVGNYVRFEPAVEKTCAAPSGQRDYCHPSSYRPQPDLLLHNRLGDTFSPTHARFVDLTALALPGASPQPTLGVIATILEGDARASLYVAHDDQPNALWRPSPPRDVAPSKELSSQEFRYDDIGLVSGVAVNGRGQPEGSMGIEAGDIDGDGREDFFVTHLSGQTHTLYVANSDGATFSDETRRRGLGYVSQQATGFGAAMLDVDNDCDLDLLAVNGAVRVLEGQRHTHDARRFAQPNQLFLNRGDGSFNDASASEPALQRSHISRGLAVGDLDNDGDLDAVVANNRGPARLLLNQRGQDQPWFGVRLVDHQRDALGARIVLGSGAPRPQIRRSRVDGSYTSSRDPRVLFGLGCTLDAPPESTAEMPESAPEVVVTWVDGVSETFPRPALGAYTALVRGTGRSLTPESRPTQDSAPDSASVPAPRIPDR